MLIVSGGTRDSNPVNATTKSWEFIMPGLDIEIHVKCNLSAATQPSAAHPRLGSISRASLGGGGV